MSSRRYPAVAGKPRETVLIINPDVFLGKIQNARSIEERAQEIESLSKAINLEHLQTISCPVSRIQPSHFLGKGKIEEIAQIVEEREPSVVVFNYSLSPVQQRNLERAWKCKVIDRTGLILEIFGERAQTKEGRLQVELAALEYQKSRLVRSWTHLERQRGGAGFMGGPGETQIELDRRIIGDKITKLKKEIASVKKMRDLGRKSRQRVPFPIVALVGYTNAGKSTLFNRLTESNVFAKDLLFATLDPTLRKIELPSGMPVILSDTVGFISDLPTHLIAAFRATLEEALNADVIVHVIDSSRNDYEAQRQDVIDILESLGIDYEQDARIIEIYNKIDAVNSDMLADIKRHEKRADNVGAISALDGEGIDRFYAQIQDILSKQHRTVRFEIDPSDGKAQSWLYEKGEVLEREDKGNISIFTVILSPENIARFNSMFDYNPL
ncbi:MAG: GTPase HflX [Alphaproteobacteria bacterium]